MHNVCCQCPSHSLKPFFFFCIGSKLFCLKSNNTISFSENVELLGKVITRPGVIPTPELESNDDSDSDFGVGIICSSFWWSRSRNRGDWNRSLNRNEMTIPHIMYTVPPNKKSTHRVRNTAMRNGYVCLGVDCCAVCISTEAYSMQACQLILFNNGPQQLRD